MVKAIGERATRRYALTAERFDGKRARELGLLAECYPASELDAALEQWLANLRLNSPQALKACKNLLVEVGPAQLDDKLRQFTGHAIATLRVSAEGQEGLNAFLDKRTPAWQESRS
ncbi:1,4-Dihydroxy-2-naphthoyl-CoA synthase [compost metagenome]